MGVKFSSEISGTYPVSGRVTHRLGRGGAGRKAFFKESVDHADARCKFELLGRNTFHRSVEAGQ